MSSVHTSAMQLQSGNWVFSGNSTAFQGTTIHGGAGISQNGSALLLDLVPLDQCLPVSPAPVVNTSVSGNTVNVTATMGSVVLTMQLTGNATQMAGTYSISGGCANDHGTVTLTYVPPITGTWTGQIVRLDGTSTGMSLTLKVTQTPTSLYGFYTVTGTAEMSGSGCFVSSTVASGAPALQSPATIPSYVAGDTTMLFLNSGSTTVNVIGGLDGPGFDKSMHALVSSSTCPDVSGTAILAKQ